MKRSNLATLKTCIEPDPSHRLGGATDILFDIHSLLRLPSGEPMRAHIRREWDVWTGWLNRGRDQSEMEERCAQTPGVAGFAIIVIPKRIVRRICCHTDIPHRGIQRAPHKVFEKYGAGDGIELILK